jgi:hypothetical protein
MKAQLLPKGQQMLLSFSIFLQGELSSSVDVSLVVHAQIEQKHGALQECGM